MCAIAYHALLDEAARITVETEEQRAGIDPDLLDRDTEFLRLVLQRDDFFGTRIVTVDLSRQIAQIGCVLILHNRYRLPVQARQLAAVLILHPIIVVALVLNDLALRVSRHVKRTVADQFGRRRIDSPGVIEISCLPYRLEDMSRNNRDADRI